MGSFRIIAAANVPSAGGASFGNIVIGPQIDDFVFNGSPKTLDKNIVPQKSLAIHSDNMFRPSSLKRQTTML